MLYASKLSTKYAVVHLLLLGLGMSDYLNKRANIHPGIDGALWEARPFYPPN